MQNSEGAPIVKNSLVIWDKPKLPEDIFEEVLLWQSFVNQDNFFSVPGYLEQHAKRFKIKYLKFIHELGESKFKGKRIVEYLDIGDGFSIWWMTLLAEKNPFKSPAIYDCLRLMALEEILIDKPLHEVKLFSEDKNLRFALQKLCENLQIKFSWEILGHNKNKRPLLRKIFHALPHVTQAIIHLTKFVYEKWHLQKLKIPAWYSGKSTFFFALISCTWT